MYLQFPKTRRAAWPTRVVAVLVVLVTVMAAGPGVVAATWYANRSHRFINVASGGRVIDNKYGDIINGNPVWLWSYQTDNNLAHAQEWFEYYRDTDGAEVHYAWASGWNITNHVLSANAGQANTLFLYEYVSSNEQRWYPVYYASNYSKCGGWGGTFHLPQVANCEARLLVANTSLCLDDKYSSTEQAATLWMWPCHGQESQMFWDMTYV
ncbi:RICIN domain-containing protein [Streptosporangium amethystogenes]|uniref:RICIN domain-containing protein n=1 Tax=Streptosporangium amethystogenes TaxID=2002 RepID=UPI0037B32493